MKELIITEHFGGQIRHSNIGMRSEDEVETYYLEKGDKIYIERKKKTKKGRCKA